MNANDIVKAMYDQDLMSQWLGIEFIKISAGYCQISMMIREEMTNGFKIAHGGISFSFADSAFAFASNSRGRHAVSIESSISHFTALKAGDKIIATTIESNLAYKTASYLVEVHNRDNILVAQFKGTVYRKSTEWS